MYFNLFYMSCGGTFFAPFFQLVELAGRAGGDDGDGAIGVVLHRTGNAQFQCFFPGTLPVKNTVHLAAYHQ